MSTRPLLSMTSSHPPSLDADSLVSIALVRFQAGALDAAETLCREALSVTPDHPRALGVLGAALLPAGGLGEVLEFFERQCRLELREPLHWMNLGTTRRLLGRYDDALAAFMHAAQLGEASADFFYNVGLAHLDRHDYESA